MGVTQYSFNILPHMPGSAQCLFCEKTVGCLFIKSPETLPRHVDRTMFNKIITKKLAALEFVHVSIYFAWYVGMCRRKYCKRECVKPFLILIRGWHSLIWVSYSKHGGENISWWCTNIRCSSHFLCFCNKIVVSWGRGREEGWGCDEWGRGLIII